MPIDPRLEAFLTDGREVFSSVQQGQHLWQADPFDVEALNAPARRAFKRLLERAASDTPPDAGRLLLLLGESGSGKTHLVRAFRNLAHGQRQGFVGYMPMTVDATSYDRYILSNLIDSLDRPYGGATGDDSGLMRLSDALMANCKSAFAPLIPDEDVLEDEELHGTIHAVADELLEDARFQTVEVDLLRALIYLQRRDPRISRRIFHWLRCEELSAVDRKVIGELIPRTADDGPARMVEHLGRLMGALGQALVLCVDQVEDFNDFEERPRLESSFRRAMSSLSAIASRVPRAVVVVCCLSDYWVDMRPHLTQSLVDRIEHDPEPVHLEQTVTSDTARDIAARRLRALYELRGVAIDPTNPTWPIPASGFDELGGQRARDVLNECRRYRERALQDQQLPETFPLVRPKAGPATTTKDTSPPKVNLDQAWTDFKATYRPQLPEEASDIAMLLAWAIELGSDELGGSPRFAVKPKADEAMDVTVQPDGGKLHVALCERDTIGGALGRQMAEALKAATGKTPVLVRTSDFPPARPGGLVAEQLGLLTRKGGRRVVLGDGELRELVALREFRKDHEGKAALTEWSRTARPVTRLKSVGDILGLERLGASPPPSSPPPSEPTPRNTATGGTQSAASRAEPRGAQAARQSNLFADTSTTPLLREDTGHGARAEATGASTASRPQAARQESATRKPPPSPGAPDDAPMGLTVAGSMLSSSSRTATPPAGTPVPASSLAVTPPAGTPVPAGLQLRKHSVTPTPVPAAPRELLTGPVRLGASEGFFTQTISLEPTELTRHSAFLGGTGSGKTTLALNVLEQLLLQGVPAILIDRKGDLATYARELSWQEKLEEPSLNERRRLLRERVEVAVYTPGRSDGRPLAIPVVPRGLETLPAEEREQGVQQAADAIAGMLEYKSGPNDKAARALLAQALRLLVQRPLGRDVTLELLQQFVADQDESLLQEAGGLPPKTFSKLAQDLEVLRLNLRSLLAAGGERLDLEELLGRGAAGTPGKTRLSIISTKFLGDNNRILFWVSQLLLETNRWTSQHPASQLQAVLLFDEADLYLPATSKPATKQPLEDLLKRARSAGVGVMLATQSPGDLDYKCRENVRTWFVGRVKEDNAIKKLRPMFTEARVDADAKLPSQKQGQFHVLRDGQVQQLKADRSVMRTEQLAEDEILKLARQTLEKGRSTPTGTPKAGGSR
ncbi:helicase HerA-like domain-containing protein [Pyxidicoccus trucidator]|uniref:helicase HerA-like domain-containing protein n=1 Tax=Pyxidicoccus trucidator TaxID=2709662 RepID=UPI0013DB5CE5|nr:AAA family ATPase [Pyxidicoccus trucidator]